MELLDRAAVPSPTLRTEEVPMPSLGGKVIVRGRGLQEQLALNALHVKGLVPIDGETADQAAQRIGAELVVTALASQVLLGDGKPMWSADQWAVHGANHLQELFDLHGVAQRLSGEGSAGQPAEDVAKN